MKVPEGKVNKNLILVEVYGEPTRTAKPKKWYVSEEITDQQVCVFDTKMQLYSDNSVYKNTKGLYIKKGGKCYYLGDFK
jgi:hypothetical protein